MQRTTNSERRVRLCVDADITPKLARILRGVFGIDPVTIKSPERLVVILIDNRASRNRGCE
jgi:hypothetical protein